MLKLVNFSLIFVIFFEFNLIKILRGDELRDLPSIWSDGDDGQGTIEQSYRFLSEIKLLDSSKSYFTEEWASATREKFRLDLMESPTNKRRTLLADFSSNENFSYQPFTCHLLANLSEGLFPELLGKFPETNASHNQVAPIGIGALWLYALRLKSDYLAACPKHPETNEKRSIEVEPNGTLQCFEYFSSYNINATDEFRFHVSFLFRRRGRNTPLDESKNLAFIRLIEPEKDRVVMRIKMLELERLKSSSGKKLRDSEVFDLPEGYGCKRGAQFEHPFRSPFKVLGSQREPFSLKLDIVSMQAANENEDIEKWKTHSVSVRMVAGRLSSSIADENANEKRNRDYLVLELQDYGPSKLERKQVVGGLGQGVGDSRLLAQVNDRESAGNWSRGGWTSTLRRVKRIWDLGSNGLEVAGGSGRAASNAVFFELDERNSKCIAYGKVENFHASRIEFPFSSSESTLTKTTGKIEEGKGGRKESYSFSLNSFHLTGMTLNSDLLTWLFSTEDSDEVDLFQLIKTSTMPVRKGYVYERRINGFEIRDQQGKLTWLGPVSLIRKHTLYAPDSSWSKNVTELPFEIKSSVTIQFLSSNLDQIIGKVFIGLGERENINIAAFHRELNVADCYSRGNSAQVASSLEGPNYSTQNFEDEHNKGKSKTILMKTIGGSSSASGRKRRHDFDIILSYAFETDFYSVHSEGLGENCLDVGNRNEQPHPEMDEDDELVREKRRRDQGDSSSCESSRDNNNKLLANQAVEALIYERFLRSIHLASKGQFDVAMQLSDVSIEVSGTSGILQISARLLNRQTLLEFSGPIRGLGFKNSFREIELMMKRQRIKQQDFKRKIFTEFKETPEACAESCKQLNCSRFVYCEGKTTALKVLSTCHLDLAARNYNYSSSASFKEEDLELDETCSLFRAEKSVFSMSPLELVHRLRKLINEQSANSHTNPLEIILEAEHEALVSIASDSFFPLSFTPTKLDVDPQVSHEQSREDLSGGQVSQAVSAQFELIFTHRSYKLLPEVQQKANHLSEEECENLCKELPDCRSFSYCPLKETRTCQVSSLHQDKAIEEASEPTDLCYILALDYLSKFTLARHSAQPAALLVHSKKQVAESARDCAISCMDDENSNQFKCRSFYYCADSQECYQRQTHLLDSIKSDLINEQPSIGGRSNCQLYITITQSNQESYLDEFDRFYGKSVRWEHEVKGKTLTILDSSAEVCALECAEHQLGCSTFRECRTESGTPTCTLFLDTAWLPRGSSGDVSDLLTENENCTMFRVTADSDLMGKLRFLSAVESSSLNAGALADEEKVWFIRVSPLALSMLPVGVVVGYATRKLSCMFMRWRFTD